MLLCLSAACLLGNGRLIFSTCIGERYCGIKGGLAVTRAPQAAIGAFHSRMQVWHGVQKGTSKAH